MTAQAAGVGPGGATTASDATAIERLAWVLCVVMMLIYSDAWLAPIFGETVDPQNSGLIRTLYFPAYAIGAFLLVLKPRAALAGLIREPFLVLLLCIVAASIVWSVSPDETLRRVVAVGFTTLCGVVIGARWRWPELAELVAVTFALLLVGSAIAGIAFPSVGRMNDLFPGSWRGLWQEKNLLGGMMAFGLLIFAATALLKPERRWFWFVMSGLAFVMLLLSTSKTSLVALAVGVAAFGLVVLVRRGRSLAVIAIYGATLALVALTAAVVLAPDVFLNLLGKDATLTGRTKIWAAVMGQIRLRPWLGYGYGAVWTEDTNWGPLAWIIKQAGFRPAHAHDSWLEQWLGMGLVGLGAWTLYYLTTLGRAIGAMFTSKGALVVLPFLALFTVIAITESIAVVYNDLRWVIFVAFSVRLALPEREPLSGRADARPPRR